MRTLPSIRLLPAFVLAVAVESRGGTVVGSPQIGNGIPDGLGATTGVLYLEISGLPGGGEVPLELVFSSSAAHADPVTCSEPSPEPCARRGKGLASVNGFPTSIFPFASGIKLGAATYLGRSTGIGGNDLHGDSFEMALEGGLYAGDRSAVGAPADLRLFEGNVVQLIEWGSGSSTPSQRPFPHRTGTGVLLGDEIPLLFPGWLRGTVDAANGTTIVVRFQEAEILAASHPSLPGEVRLLADYAAAAAAGLPPGTFGAIEVNVTGLASRSSLVPAGVSNDVEIRITAEPDAVTFIRGDCDGDSMASGSVTDGLYLLAFNFTGGPAPPCLAACDANGDGEVVGVVNDALYMLQHSFSSGPAPPPPYPNCGADPEPRGLSCDEPPDC